MSKIYSYQKSVDPSWFSSIRAMISFSETPAVGNISNVKQFAPEEAKKGLEQLKRWVSTGAFGCVLLDGFIEALAKGNSSHIRQWLADHSSEPDFPTLILLGDSSIAGLEGLVRVVDSSDELLKIINT